MLRHCGRSLRKFSVFTDIADAIVTPDVEVVRPGTPGSVIVVHHGHAGRSPCPQFEAILSEGLKSIEALIQEGRLFNRSPFLEDRNDVIFFRPPLKPLTEKDSHFPDFISQHGGVINGIRSVAVRERNWVAVSVNPAATYVYDGYYRKKNRPESYAKSRTRLLDLFEKPEDLLRSWEVIVRCPVIAPKWFATDSRRYWNDLQLSEASSCHKKQ